MSKSAHKRWNSDGPVELSCDNPGCPRPGGRFELLPCRARQRPGRFCSIACLTQWLHHGEGADERHEARDEGEREWRDKRAGWKALLEAAGFIVGVEPAGRTLPRQLRRSPAAVSGHIAGRRLTPALRLEDLRLVAFTDQGITSYRQLLERHQDGRLTRFNATTSERAEFVRDWTGARHGGHAKRGVSGRLAPELAAAGGNKVGADVRLSTEQEARIRKLATKGGKGGTIRAIAGTVGVPKGRVERFLQREKLSRNP